MNIVVLCGGISTEREISLRTSTKVSNALRSIGHHVVMIDIFFGEEEMPSFDNSIDFSQKADEYRAKDNLITDELIEKTGLFGKNVLEICKKSDIVFIGLHGKNGEDGKVQAAFDKEGIKYTGSDSKSSAIAMSKAETKAVVAPHILMPKGIVLNKGDKEYIIKAPCVIKPSNGGSSLGVMIVKTEEEFGKALEEDFKFDDTVLVEEFIEGRELTQAVIDGVAYPPVEICPDEDEWYDYINKYNGKTTEICPAQIPESVLAEMSEKSVKFGNLVGLSVYYRIDYLLTKDGTLYALEANSLPGMTDTSLVPQEAAAVGINYPDLCEKIIEISLRKYN
ncbi:MAG: D-alanine--D-alanine ligase [Lachnospiraceae bacterium]|nr:D-alanine--D-alanine ligase [Lachnospiraceae bacterium]